MTYLAVRELKPHGTNPTMQTWACKYTGQGELGSFELQMYLAKGKAESEDQLACKSLQAKQLYVKGFNSSIGKYDRFFSRLANPISSFNLQNLQGLVQLVELITFVIRWSQWSHVCYACQIVQTLLSLLLALNRQENKSKQLPSRLENRAFKCQKISQIPQQK